MAGNTFGKIFTVTTCGESHGLALAAIVDGVPPGLPLDESIIQVDLDRRRPGSTRYGTPRNEKDQVKIISGVFEGRTTGTPVGLIIENTSQRSQDYSAIKDAFRPGHADLTYQYKYGIRDYRGGGRASARETAMRVAAGAIAKIALSQEFGIQIQGAVTAIGPHQAKSLSFEKARQNPFNFADPSMLDTLGSYIDSLRERHDSCGAVVEVRATHMPIGLGNPVFDRLDATIAQAMMSINAVKGVEIGDGFALAAMEGTQARDEMREGGFLSNHMGGILGGISSGQDLIVRIALKPTSSILTPGHSINKFGEEIEVSTFGRHDPCVGIRAVPIAEAMLALCLIDAALADRAQCSSVERHSFFKG